MKKFEKFAVLGILIGSAWAVRLVFIFFIGDHWFGTLGVTSALFGSVTYFSWHGKLGRFGVIYKEILTMKIAKKLRKIAMFMAFFWLLLFSLYSVGVHTGETVYAKQTQDIRDLLDEKDVDMSYDGVLNESAKLYAKSPGGYLVQVLAVFIILPVIIIFDFPFWATIATLTNDMLWGSFQWMSTTTSFELQRQARLMGQAGHCFQTTCFP